MTVVGLIPARGGSKGIPGKNLIPLAGKPLLAWTTEAASASRVLDRIVVSTDSERIADAARELGVEVLRRPEELAGDETPMLDVILHAIAQLDDPLILVLLQPTSPLRRAEHVNGAVAELLATGADTVVSVIPLPHNFLPGSLFALRDARLEAVAAPDTLLRQAKPMLYARNGPAVLALRTPGLATRGFYGGDVRPYVMDAWDSIDIDEPRDLELAELLLNRSRAHPEEREC